MNAFIDPRTPSRLTAAMLAGAALAVSGCGLDEGDSKGETTSRTAPRTTTAPATTQPSTQPGGTVMTPDGQMAQTGQSSGTEVTQAQGGTTPQGAPAAGTPAGQTPAGGAPSTTTAPAATAPGTTTPGTTGTTATTPGVTQTTGPAPATQLGDVVPSPGGSFAGGRFFSTDSPWNTQITGVATDQRSFEMLELANRRVAVVERRGGRGGLRRVFRRNREGVFVNTRAWAPPVVSEQRGVTTRIRCRQTDCGPDSAVKTLRIPKGTRFDSRGRERFRVNRGPADDPRNGDPDPRYDGWFTVLDRPRGVAFDLWRARRESDGSVSYHYIRKWDLNGPGFQAPQVVGARGSGLPLFAGLVRPEEIRRGKVDHALAISIPGAAQRRYVQPASRTDGNGSTLSVPEGARLRLLPGSRPGRLAKTRKQRRAANAILEALETYGAIVVDRSAVPTMYAQRNVDWRKLGLRGNELQNIKLEDFEVIQLGPYFEDPPRSTTAPEQTQAPTQGQRNPGIGAARPGQQAPTQQTPTQQAPPQQTPPQQAPTQPGTAPQQGQQEGQQQTTTTPQG